MATNFTDKIGDVTFISLPGIPDVLLAHKSKKGLVVCSQAVNQQNADRSRTRQQTDVMGSVVSRTEPRQSYTSHHERRTSRLKFDHSSIGQASSLHLPAGTQTDSDV